MTSISFPFASYIFDSKYYTKYIPAGPWSSSPLATNSKAYRISVWLYGLIDFSEAIVRLPRIRPNQWSFTFRLSLALSALSLMSTFRRRCTIILRTFYNAALRNYAEGDILFFDLRLESITDRLDFFVIVQGIGKLLPLSWHVTVSLSTNFGQLKM